MRHVARGFTLIEMLVVVAIISLLIAMLLPALGLARESARRGVCATQYSMIGQSIMTFAADNYGYGPPHTLGMLRNDYLLVGMTLNAEHSDRSIYLGHLVDLKYISSRDLNGGQLMFCPSRDPWDRYGYWGGADKKWLMGMGWQNWGPRGPGGEGYNWNQFVEVSYGYVGCINMKRFSSGQLVLGVECFWKDTYVRDSVAYHTDKQSYGAVRAHKNGYYNVLMLDGGVRNYTDRGLLEALPPRAGRDGVLIVQSTF